MKTHFITFLLLVGMSLGISSRLHAQSSYQPGEENLKAREEFQDNKFGIFLHWGLYAMLATGEWTMTNNNLNYKCSKKNHCKLKKFHLIKELLNILDICICDQDYFQ